MFLNFKIKKLHKLLRERGLTISVAESCTGGKLSALLTKYSGASNYFDFGAITYSNDAKNKILAVKKETLKKYGAVSSQTAAEMAKGLKSLRKTDVTIAITGIAGPESDSTKKQLGLVYIAIFYKKLQVKKFKFSGSREIVQKKSLDSACDLLKNMI